MQTTKQEWEQYYNKYIEKKHLPEFLYKFRRWHCGHKEPLQDNECIDCKRNRLILTGPAVWFAPPNTFNDPFDSKIPFRYDQLSSEKQLQRARDHGRERHPEWSQEQLQREAETVVRNNPMFSVDPIEQANAHRKFSCLMSKYFRVLSLSGTLESNLLWSHYAESHQGFCVEIDAHQLAKHLFDLLRTDKVAIDFMKVRYDHDVPIVIPSMDKHEDMLRYKSLLAIKSVEWQYEHEWRFIYLKQSDGGITRYIQPDIIKRVIVGCQMLNSHREEITQLVSTQLPKTELWEAYMSPTQFKLLFRPLKS